MVIIAVYSGIMNKNSNKLKELQKIQAEYSATNDTLDQKYAEAESKQEIKKYVAQIGKIKYETLKDAIAVVGDEETTILMLDNTIEEDIIFPENKKIILDLAGKTVESDLTTIINQGTLKLTGKGTLTSTRPEGTDVSTITFENQGDLVIDDAYITMKPPAESEPDRGGTVFVNKGTTTMNSGSIYSNERHLWVAENRGVFNFNGGTIELNKEKVNAIGTALFNTSGTINMTGGNVKSTGIGVAIHSGVLNATGEKLSRWLTCLMHLGCMY